jgi:serine/threonine protein kinase
MASTLTCLNCGETVRLADRFCSQCGDELTLSSHPTALLETELHPDDDPESPWAEVVQRLRRALFGEFDVGRELGRGGMAAVFLAHDVSLDRKVAIKVMAPGLLMGEGMIERFRREAITIAHLNHPNIVSCFSVRQAGGLHFFVMRYIRGRSLEQIIHDSGRLPVAIARSILCQVGSALTYAHRSGVVHRDVKPANILIDEDGNAVVTDFGIAKVAQLPGSTHSGALVGTPAYMSPEQCRGGEVSGASDQYSLGAVAYEMVTGVAPFIGSTLTVMQAQVEQPPTPIRERVPDCPPDLEAAILRMLAKDPAERFPNMADAKMALGATPLLEDDPLLAELSRLAAASSTPPATTPVPVSPVPQGASAVAGRSAVAGPARSVVILPPPAELVTGDSFALVALVRGERGTPLPSRTVEWTTDAPDVLHLDRTRNVATAVAPGSAVLIATCDGVLARVQVRVPPALELFDRPLEEAASIQISAPPKAVRAGDSFVLTATPLDPAGQPLAESTVLWSTSDVRVAVVTAEGWVAALGRGQVMLTATRGATSASIAINVEHAIPARRPERPARGPTPVAAPLSAGTEDEPDHRSTWRRRGNRSRRALVRGTAGLAAVAACLWLFGGLRDFRWTGGLPWVAASDSVPAIADSIPGSEPVDSGAPADQAVTATTDSAPARRRVATQRRPASSASADFPDRGGPDSGRVTAEDTLEAGAAVAPEFAGDNAFPDPSAYAPLEGNAERDDRLDQPPPPVATTRPSRPTVARPKPLPSAERRELESRMRQGVDDCYGAVRSKNLDRVATMYRPRTYADDEKLKRLTTILRTEPWRAMVGKRVDGVREMSADAGAAEFSFRLTWRGTHGGQLSSQPIFRAEFARDAGGWTMSSCRIVGSPKL